MTIVTPNKIEEKPAHRELVFETNGNDAESLSLMIKDRAPRGVKSVSVQPFYKIPLYQSQARERDDEQADVELVHVYPKRYAHAASKITDHEDCLRDGFLYVYVNGYLWRELKITHHTEGNFTTFSDVNLAFQKGEHSWKPKIDEREATGEALKSVLVPHKLDGQTCDVQMAYSETQWSWRQIQLFGGMNPNDPRLNYGQPVKTHIVDQAKSAQYRAKRMTTLDELSSYQQGYSNQRHPEHLVIPMAESTAVYSPILPDEIGRIRAAAKEVATTRKALELLQVATASEQRMCVDTNIPKTTELQASKHIIAQLIHSQFFAFPEHVKEKVAKMGEDNVNEAERDLAADYEAWAESSLNITEFREFLNTEKVLSTAKFINEIKTKAYEIFTEESEHASFYQSLRDFAYFQDSRRFDLYEVLSDTVAPFKDTTADLVKSAIITPQDKEALSKLDKEDMGQELILKVIGGHPEDTESEQNILEVVKLCFPKSTGPNFADFEDWQEDDDPFDVNFNAEDFKRFNQDDAHLEEPMFQLLRRGTQVVWGFLNVTLEVPTTAFLMNKYAQPFNSAYATHIKQENELKSDIKKINNGIRELNQEIAAKQAEIAKLQAHKTQMRGENVERGLDPAQTDAHIQNEINKRLTELEVLQNEARQAKNANVRTKRHLANLNSAGQGLLALAENVKIRDVAVRTNPYLNFMHLSNLITGDLLQEIEIDANDYLKGNLPDNKIPLNFLNRAERASQRLQDFNRASMAFDGDMKPTENAAKANLKINKQHTIQSRLDHIVHLDGALDEVERMIDEQILAAEQGKQVLRRKLLVIDGTKLAELKSDNKAFGQQLKDTNKDMVNANWQAETYQQHTENLSRYKKWNLNPALFDGAFKAILPLVTTLEVLNFYRVIEDDGASKISVVSAAFDLADLMISIGRNIVEYKIGLPTNTQVQQFIRGTGVPANLPQTRILSSTVRTLALKVALIVVADSVTFVASGISAYCELVNMSKAWGAGNTGLAIGHGIMAAGFVTMAGVSALTLMGHAGFISVMSLGPLFWVGLIIVFIGAGLIYWFSESEVQSWLEACPWGVNRYVNDDANTSSIRASQWQERPDYCLMDLYNVLYKPHVRVDHNEFAQHITVTLYVPKVARENGLNFTLQWRKLIPFGLHWFNDTPEFQTLSLKQLEQIGGEWQIFPNRTGWQVTMLYSRVIEVLGLRYSDEFEIKASVTAYPRGKGAKTLEAFDSEFGLPVRYISESGLPVTHQIDEATSIRRIRYFDTDQYNDMMMP